MEKRTTESPMDFEWQSSAPGDCTSPFYQLAKEGKKRQYMFPLRSHLVLTISILGPFGVFDSPSKPLNSPSKQSFFSQPRSTFHDFSHDPAFATPRKLDFDFSSGVENSPDANADSEDTPDKQSNNTGRRNSLFNFYGRFAPSPGRGEIPRSNKLSNVVINRVHKQRKKERDMRRHFHKTSDLRSASQEGYAKSESIPNVPQKSQDIPFFSRFFTFLEAHPHIPRILSYYAQFTFNLILAFLTLYVIITFLLAIQHDVTRASEEVSADILAEMATCAKNYVENRCSGTDGKRLPALETVCDNWERCMNRDPAKVGRAKVSAQTLAEIFNGFIEPISFKTMIFFLASVTSCVAVSNLTFSFFRNKSNNPPEPVPHYRPFTPPGQHSRSSRVVFATGPGFGMSTPCPRFPDHNSNSSQAFYNLGARDDMSNDQDHRSLLKMGDGKNPIPFKRYKFSGEMGS
ncbi:hypothetical protein LOZ65_001861 [Ophidiomyces ophidiicola]|nr:hypothetical protein LOZ65_001861 [Ophidiomyces ophidiicola]